jgi:phosphate uptake regulator
MRTAGGFEGRRIQRTGGSTYIVSLPKPWVTTRGLSAGDVLLFAPRPDGSLTLYTEKGEKSEPTRRVVMISNEMDSDHLFRQLVAEYIAGASLLEIRTTGRMSARTREVVRGFAQRMIGPEILEESADGVVLQDVVGANPLPLPSVIRRMQHMVSAMQADAMTAFSERDAAIAQDVVQRDWEVDRLHWFVQKQVTLALRDQRQLASLGLSLPECSTFLQASRVLERIADHAVRIAEVTEWVRGSPVPKNQVDELTRLSATARQLLDTAVGTLFEGDMAAANRVLDSSDEIVQHRKRILDTTFSKPGRIAVALAYVLESLERTVLYASDLAEIAINYRVERDLMESPAAKRVERPPVRVAPKIEAA